MRRALLVLAMMLALPLAVHAQSPGQSAGAGQGTVALRSDVQVDRDRVTLGDLFTGLPPTVRGDVPVAPAPQPGGRSVLDAGFLQTLAATYGLAWTPSRLDKVTVSRAGATLGADAMRAVVAPLLAQRGIVGDVDIVFDNEQARLIAPSLATPISVDQFTFDPIHHRFVATLSAGTTERLVMPGRIMEAMTIAVPARPIQAGERIQPRDLKQVRIRLDQLGRTAATQAESIIGKIARRMLPPDQPIRVADIEMPILVRRNGLVTVNVVSGRLVISMQAKALDDGADGATVRVQNPRGNKIFEGIVTGPGMVTLPLAPGVAPPAAAAAVR